ncbi:MAG: hypothetical protein PHS02_01695 [Candidatus ainarchaeum sp.]|nr:hypothetical protein [Candidatus ainarchaeum sp.]
MAKVRMTGYGLHADEQEQNKPEKQGAAEKELRGIASEILNMPRIGSADETINKMLREIAENGAKRITYNEKEIQSNRTIYQIEIEIPGYEKFRMSLVKERKNDATTVLIHDNQNWNLKAEYTYDPKRGETFIVPKQKLRKEYSANDNNINMLKKLPKKI